MRLPTIQIIEGTNGVQYEYFTHKRKKVSIFENIFGEWVASDGLRTVTAETKEAAILKYIQD